MHGTDVKGSGDVWGPVTVTGRRVSTHCSLVRVTMLLFKST